MKFYHGENHDMWMKGCIPLGQFVSDSGHKLDLGGWEDPHDGEPSFAIVYAPEGHQYISGAFRSYKLGSHDYQDETIKRYNDSRILRDLKDHLNYYSTTPKKESK